MGDPPSPNKEFEDLKKKFDGRYDLWNNYVNFKEQKQKWKNNNIRQMDS